MKKLLLFVAGLTVALAVQNARAEEDVFLDEADADFKMDVPAPGSAPADSAQTPPAPAPAVEPAPPMNVDAVAMPTDLVEPTAATEPTPKKEKKAAKKIAAPDAGGAPQTVAKGEFLTTKTECPMHREPASESDTLIKVKSERKLWVESVNEGWVKGFRKEGMGHGFLSRDCFQ